MVLLFGRTGLFLAIQSLFALGYVLAGSPLAWERSAAWWPIVVTIVNLICLAVMITLFRSEGKNYWEIFLIRREWLKSDVMVLLGGLLITGPVACLPNVLLANALFGDMQPALDLLLRPLPVWAAYASLILFPVTQGLEELALYFLAVMPRLDARRFPDLHPVALPALMLGLQHLAIPFLFDLRYIAWRALMYVPFAFLAGILLHSRPRLLPYFALVHTLMDMAFAAMLLAMAY